MYNYQLNKKKSSKIDDNKHEKANKLLDTAFRLFTEKGIKNTSIQEIANEAGVAKGTFYLYFQDKYELQDHLLARTSHRLFARALKESTKENITRLDDKIVFIIDYIINTLINNPLILKFIQKNLSLGLYSEKMSDLIEDEQLGLKELFLHEVKVRQLNLPHPEVTLFMIIELVSATAFSSIINNQPLPIEEYKPILYQTIKNLINEDGVF